MDLFLLIVDIIFQLLVLVSAVSAAAYLFYGRKLAMSLKTCDNKAWLSLGKPVGLYNFTMRSTPLIENYINNNLYKQSENSAIINYGNKIALSKSVFHNCSAGCLICLLLIVILK